MQLLMIGTTELLVIGGAILLLFGGKKIPELMRSMGQGVRNFKEGMNESIQEDLPNENPVGKQTEQKGTIENPNNEIPKEK